MGYDTAIIPVTLHRGVAVMRCWHVPCSPSSSVPLSLYLSAYMSCAAPLSMHPPPGSTDTTPMGWVNTYRHIGIIHQTPLTVRLYVAHALR